jgi:predicted MFS family arabinose efflux permease
MARPHVTTRYRKLGLLGSLYFSQGLPFGFFTQALPLLMRARGYSLESIGLSSLLAAPWALKFVWSPLVDRWGARRTWILPLQLLTAATLLVTSAAENDFRLVLGSVLLTNFFCASQDIATDGLAVDMLTGEERGLANGVQVAGYRVGMIVGGGVLLIVHEELRWTRTFLVMAAIVVVASAPIAFARQPARAAHPEGRAPLHFFHFFQRPGVLRVLGIVVTYKAAEAFAAAMLRPFLADRGMSLEDVGWMLGTVGFVAGLLGAMTGGALVNRLGRRRALVVFGLFQAASVALYAIAALQAPTKVGLTALAAVEHFASGTATAALFTAMMDWSRKETSATDYTVQASAVVLATGLAATFSGFSAARLGYAGHFGVATVMALLALLPVLFYFPKTEER